MKIFFFVLFVLLVSGCATKATQQRISAQQSNTLACQQRVLDIKKAMAETPAPTFTDSRDALLYLTIKEVISQKQTDDLAGCDDALIAMVGADAQRVNKIVDGGFSIGRGFLKLWGLDIIVDGAVSAFGSQGGDYTINGGINMNNAAGAGGEAAGGMAMQGLNIGGSQNLLKDATQVQAEKFQDNAGQSGTPLLDDSNDGAGEGNDTGINLL